MKILIAIDGSPPALEGVRFAVRLASQLKTSRLTLLYVRPSHVGAVVSWGAPDLWREARLEEEIGAVEQDVLTEACAIIKDAGLEAEQRVETGAPGPAIIRVAADEKFEMVVLGSRGHGELKSLLLGSTSAAVVHGAPCPVLVVR